MLLDHGGDSISNIKPQKGKELIVEWHRSGHVFNGYLDVVNDRLHCISQIVAQPPPNETVLSHSESFREQARSRQRALLHYQLHVPPKRCEGGSSLNPQPS